jgi:hypothetical protein
MMRMRWGNCGPVPERSLSRPSRRQARAWETLHKTKRPTRSAEKLFKKAHRAFARRWLNRPPSAEKTLQRSQAG